MGNAADFHNYLGGEVVGKIRYMTENDKRLRQVSHTSFRKSQSLKEH